jgi:hypothetical protein
MASGKSGAVHRHEWFRDFQWTITRVRRLAMLLSTVAPTSAAANDDVLSVVPRVTCPTCGTRMRLAQIQTDLTGREAVYFECSCGFEYRMSARVKAGA